MNNKYTDDDGSNRLKSENSNSNGSIVSGSNNGNGTNVNTNTNTSNSINNKNNYNSVVDSNSKPPPPSPSPKTHKPLNNTSSTSTTAQRENQKSLGGSSSAPSLSSSSSSFNIKDTASTAAACSTSSIIASTRASASASTSANSVSIRAKQNFKSPSLSSQARLRASASSSSSSCPFNSSPSYMSTSVAASASRSVSVPLASASASASASALPSQNHYYQQRQQQQQQQQNHHVVGSAATSAATRLNYTSEGASTRRNGNENGHGQGYGSHQDDEIVKGEWKIVEVNHGDNNHTSSSLSSSSLSSVSQSSCPPPCERSLHAGTLWNDQFLIFGGYDGNERRNDFYSFHLREQKWNLIIGNNDNNNHINNRTLSTSSSAPPSPRDRHCAVAYKHSFFIFGGFDGTSRVNDFYEFDFTKMAWKRIITNVAAANSSGPPSPRHSHSAVVYKDSMFVFGGYDGSYRSDFYEYNFLTNTWTNIPAVGRSPRARYRATTVTYKNKMILYGGHDGTRHLSDMHVFDFDKRIWSVMEVKGTPPLARDSHISAVYGNSMYIFGGSAGSALNDIHELRLGHTVEAAFGEGEGFGLGGLEGIALVEDGGNDNDDFVPTWKPVVVSSGSISRRFCHVGAIHDGSLYVFGGYDGNERLNDFTKFEFNFDDISYSIPPSTLISDMRSFVNNELLSDVVFIVEGHTVHAHKMMLVRCNYFRAMLTGSMMESKSSTIHLEDVSYPIFLSILEYLYTDKLDIIEIESAMELFAAADLFGIPRLQGMCERKILQSIHPENAATIFHAADEHSATMLRSKSLSFILKHFEQVSKSEAFEEMARNNVLLVIEILRLR